MQENTEVCIIEADENAEEVISEIKEKFCQNKAVVLNLSKIENEQIQKDIINFINKNFKEFACQISEKTYILTPKTNDKNIIEGDLWK